VQCFDELYELLGRRARSPWETPMLWGSGVLLAMGSLIVWNDLLFRLSHNTIMDEDVNAEEAKERLYSLRAWNERNVTWERILARMIIPTLLVGFILPLAWKVIWMDDTRDLIKANTVDLKDDTLAGLVWRD